MRHCHNILKDGVGVKKALVDTKDVEYLRNNKKKRNKAIWLSVIVMLAESQHEITINTRQDPIKKIWSAGPISRLL